MTITTDQLDTFNEKLNAVNKAHYANHPDYFKGITYTVGKKNAKFIIDTNQKSVLLFVELETGNILKAASWLTPAKGARGNILTTEPAEGTRWLYR